MGGGSLNSYPWKYRVTNLRGSCWKSTLSAWVHSAPVIPSLATLMRICNLQNQTRSTAVSQQHLWVLLVSISTLYVYLWSVYPDHPDFRGLRKDAYPEWYTDFRESFRRACNTFQLLHTGDEVFEGHRTQPLYRCIDNNKFGNYAFAKCNLKHIILVLTAIISMKRLPG